MGSKASSYFTACIQKPWVLLAVLIEENIFKQDCHTFVAVATDSVLCMEHVITTIDNYKSHKQ